MDSFIGGGVELLVLSLIASILVAAAGFGGSVILLPLLVHLFGIKGFSPKCLI